MERVVDGNGGSLQLITIFKGGTLPDSSSTRHQLDTLPDIHYTHCRTFAWTECNGFINFHLNFVLTWNLWKGNGRPRRRCGRSDIEKILRAFNSIQLKYPISS